MKTVEVTKPTVMTIASGRSISVPCKHSRMGNSPQIAVDAVIARVCVTSSSPFWTAMPKSPINPTSDETFHVSPETKNARMLPTNATGIAAKIIAASAVEFSAK